MKQLIETLDLALEALENGKRVRNAEGGTKYQPDLEDKAITAIKQARSALEWNAEDQGHYKQTNEAMTPEQTLDWLAEQHKSQCNEERPVQEWIRSMKSMLPAPTVQEPDWLDKEKLETDWDHVWLLIKASSYASSRGHISGTTNWGAAMSAYLRHKIKAAAQPAPVQEPDHGDELTIAYMSGLHDGKQKRAWVGLTDEEIDLFINGRGDEDDDDYVEPTGDGFGLTDADLVELVRRAEAKLKERNT